MILIYLFACDDCISIIINRIAIQVTFLSKLNKMKNK